MKRISAPEQDDTLLLEDEQRKVFSIVSLAFRDDNKWRLSDGLATIHAKISDANFLARVDQNLETFAKGDLLICRVMSRQWQTRSGTRAEYEVLEVLEHRRCAQQIQLPFDDAPPEAFREAGPSGGSGNHRRNDIDTGA